MIRSWQISTEYQRRPKNINRTIKQTETDVATVNETVDQMNENIGSVETTMDTITKDKLEKLLDDYCLEMKLLATLAETVK